MRHRALDIHLQGALKEASDGWWFSGDVEVYEDGEFVSDVFVANDVDEDDVVYTDGEKLSGRESAAVIGAVARFVVEAMKDEDYAPWVFGSGARFTVSG